MQQQKLTDIINKAEYVDAHTHLDMYEGGEIDRAISEITINKILSLSNSMDFESYEKNKGLGDKTEFIVPCFGVHPWKVKDESYDWNLAESQILDSPMIGEVGLDYFWVEDADTYSSQLYIFKNFVRLGQKYRKPINIHTKGAENDVLDILKEFRGVKAIIHWYSGPPELVHEYLNLGCFFTVSVDILSSECSRKLCSYLPLSRILPETDNPEGYPWLYGRKGFPEDIVKVYEAIASIKGISINRLKDIMKENLLKVMSDVYDCSGQ